MRALAFSLALLTATTAAYSQQIIFEADEDILIIRSRQVSTAVFVELVGSSDGRIRCLALDGEGTPVASTTGRADHGEIVFNDLEVGDFERVVCRYQ